MIKCTEILTEFGPLQVRNGILYAGVNGDGRPTPFLFGAHADFCRANVDAPRQFLVESIIARLDFAGMRVDHKISVCIPSNAMQSNARLFSSLTRIQTDGLVADAPYELVVSIWYQEALLREKRFNVVFDSKSKLALGLHVMPDVHIGR